MEAQNNGKTKFSTGERSKKITKKKQERQKLILIKLKLETLSKCEDVILKLYEKVKSGSHSQTSLSRPTYPPPVSAMSPTTPSSPSPPRDIPKTKPVVIPTEKIPDRSERDISLCQPSNSLKNRIDIYSSAGDSLKTPLFNKPNVFERLGRKGPDMSKPPISIEDLEALQQDVLTERLSLNELTDLREKLQKQLSTSDEGEQSRKSPINTTVRNSTILTKRAVEKATSEKSKPPEVKPAAKTSVPNKPVKVVKEASSIFGSALSSIDNKIIEGANKGKEKEKERRNSVGSKKDTDSEKSKDSKERRNSRDDKKESSSHKSSKDKETDKDKTERKSSEHRSKDKREEERKDKSKDRKDEKRDKDKKVKEDSKKHESKNEHAEDKDKKKEEVTSKGEKEKSKDDDVKIIEGPKIDETALKNKVEKPKQDENKPVEPAPVYKRLADKYNPKPRKPSSDPSLPDVSKKVAESIEKNMRNNPLPFLEINSPPKLPILPLPLLSPTSSTSTDNEVATFNRKNFLSTPQSMTSSTPLPAPSQNITPIPSHVSNILANPNNTALINTVVNQFKGRQTPLIAPNPTAFPPQPVPSPNQTFTNNNYAPNEMGNVHFNPPNQQGNFWGNQPPNPPNRMQPPHMLPHHGPSHPQTQPHPHPVPHPHQPKNLAQPHLHQQQNFQQRPFTPISNQFDNQMQPMDYYPPGGTPTNNPYNHQVPPLLSPQYDSYEPRPPRKPDDAFNKDRDYRNRDDWRRPNSSVPPRPRDTYREQTRDPRLHRERERDRSYRDDPRTPMRRESREYDRDSRNKFRDPRLNRYRYERDPDADRSKSPARKSPSRAKSPPRRSVAKDVEDTFASPLDSLYSGNDRDRRTGKGYGVQNFKIPKIKKEEDVEEVEMENVIDDKEGKKEEEVEEKKEEVKPLEETEKKEEREERESEVKEPESKSTTSVEVAKETTEGDENVASANVSSSTEVESTGQVETPKETADVGEISSTNDIQETQSRDDAKKLDDESQTDIINKFLKKLLENERTRAAASLFIDNVSNSLDDEKLKMVVQTVKSAGVEEEQPQKRPLMRTKKKILKKSAKLSAKLAAKKKLAIQRKLRLRKQRKQARVIEDDDDEEEQEAKEEKEKTEEREEEKEEKEKPEEVVVTVGERIKSRKRQAATSPKKKKVRHKTELDLLHEDIQDMFIRDGVLTATGKRMCRLLKGENESKQQPPPETRRRTRNTAEKFDSKANSEKLKAMSNVRVLIPKISAEKLSEMEDESQRYSLRRSNKGSKSYAEVDSEDEKEKEREQQREKERQRQREKEEEEEREREKQREKEREKQKEKEKEKQREKEREKQKEKEKPKAKEKKKIESDEESEEAAQEEKPATPKKMKKRAKSWASGVLPKRKKKVVEEKEDDSDKSFEFVEPDKNYFSSKLWHSKTPCKLCDYDGMNITKHYRTQHPESEVLSSRLSPQKAEDAIKQSLELKLDETEDEMLLSTKCFSFVCRFCDLEMKSQPSNFCDHISTHTGEYRHICTLCDFSASNNKPLRIHYSNKHGKEVYDRAPRTRTRVYGYICIECNFVQMNKKTVDNHVNVYHLGEGKRVLKIHLSTGSDQRVGKRDKSDERKEDEKEVQPAEPMEEDVDEQEGEEEEKEEPQAKRAKPNEKAEGKVEESAPPSPKIIKKEKEIDMRVFTCNTDIHEENEQIEQERLRKMAELNESVKTNRQSLNFVDQLSNRLLQEEKEALPPEIVTIKNEPADEEFLSEVEAQPLPEPEEIDPLLQLEPEPEPVVETTPKKPIKVMEAPVSMVQVVQKENTFIQGMIQKLQGKLKEEKGVDGPPPLAPLVERTDEMKAFLSAGFLNISKTANGLEYACRVPSCLFTTTNRDGFVTHWTEDHTRINQSYKATKCRICMEEVTATAGATLLINFFAHVENEHLCRIKTSFNAGFISIDKDRDGFEYICKVQTCTFVTKGRETFLEHLDNHKELNDHYKSTVCGICLNSITGTAGGTLLNNLFTHLETEHLEEDKIPSRSVLRTRRLSGDKLSKAKEESPEAKEEEENPFPFKISGVMSLAEESVPPLSPLREKPQSVILKESKMSAVEKAATWKCMEATKKFLGCPRELYKCPQFFCKYATSWRHLFEVHIKAHARVNDELVSCVYCDVKTPLSHAGLHIDLRHSNCLYSCSQCLYRALTREYVMIHNRLKHKENDLIIALPPKTAKTVVVSKPKQFTVKEACPAYKCGDQGCESEFLFLNEFCTHLQDAHDGLMICGFVNNQQSCKFQCLVIDNMVDHWRIHNCYHFHCLLCKTGSMEVYTMLEHYSVVHPNMEPMVVDRRNAPSSPLSCHGYTDFACSKIRYLGDELLESVNVQQYTILKADKPSYLLTTEKQRESPKPEAPKNVTLVPLSILQPNSSEPKKLIAIIPSKVDGIAAKPMQLFTTLNQDASSTASFVFASASNETAKDKEGESKEVVADGVAAAAAEEGDNSGDNIADPLSLEGEVGSVVSASGDDSDCTEVNESADMLKSFGLIGYQLYRCAFCDISFSNTRDFKAHTVHSTQCRDTTNTAKPYRCVHCERPFRNPHGLLEHIHYHGQLRFGCSLCVKKFPSPFALRVHMRAKHGVTNTITTPLIPNKTNPDRDEFILRPVPLLDSEMGKEGTSFPILGGQKTVYGPDEIDQLPKRYIFNSDVKCALCSYSTKVRTNLVRHLQFHSAEKSVPDIAPVNPVPCLDKNERMFDKMTNLAISSIAGGSSRMGGPKTEPKAVKEDKCPVPAYVPLNRRYVCCAEGCNYLCLEEANLRHHLHALHAQELSFACAHCKANLNTDIEGFLKHLKLHDLHLYKCSACSFVHNLRHKVDKHSADKHPDKSTTTITIRALDAEIIDSDQSVTGSVGVVSSDPPPAPNIKWTKPWHCGMCKYRCAAKSDIIGHIFSKHDINAQFKCTLCSYKTDDKSTFEGHFKENHPSNEIDIIYVYYKSEGTAQTSTSQKTFDTTPLWQRDRPRVRHIRGILFEETSPQKGKKGPGGRTHTSTVAVTVGSPTATTSSAEATPPRASNLDLAIDAVAKGIDECTKRREETKEAPKEDVIVIEDDDEDDDDDVVVSTPRMNDSLESTLFIDDDDTKTPDVKTEVEKEFLSEEMLFAKYGRLCTPVAKAFKCPICFKYRNKKVGPFVHHLLTELKCYRFRCNSCEFASVTFDSIGTHCQEKHDSVLTSNVKDTPLDKTVEYWLQILIKYQAKAIVQQIFIPPGEATSSQSCKSRCEYCDKWFKNQHLLKDHELYHWAEHLYTCNHCRSEHVSLNSLFQHTFMSHPSYDVDFTTSGPYVSKVISILKTPQTTAPPQAGTSADDGQYACLLCPEVERSLEALRKHTTECHEGEEPSYKMLTKAKVETMFCCTYCHERGSEKFMREHHMDKHEGLKFNIYQYICLECSGTYLNIKDLRAHFGKVHSGKKLTYSCIESKQGGSKDQYCCTKCPFRSCSLGGIRSHLRKHLRPIECLLCGATFIYPTEARAHHNKEHVHSAEKVEENKEKLREYEELVQQIVAAREKGETGFTPPPRKMLARKSTGAPFVREYSYYGSKKEETDLKSVSTSVEVNKVTTKISAEQFSNLFNIFPVVEVNDCEGKEED